MQNRSRLLRILIIALLCGASASHAEQIVNGGFELPALPPGTDFVDMTGSAIVGWTIPNGWSIGLVRDYWPAFEGDQSIDLDGDSGIGATILQTFETAPGQEYSLSFEYANNIDTATAIGRVQVLGSTALVDTTVTHSGSTTDDMHYVAFAATFTADSPLSTLQLTHLGPVWGRGLALDAVSVTLAGPTPCTSTTWGLMKSLLR
jgi:choice-of-anchor C domain-containing protein